MYLQVFICLICWTIFGPTKYKKKCKKISDMPQNTNRLYKHKPLVSFVESGNIFTGCGASNERQCLYLVCKVIVQFIFYFKQFI